MSSRIRGLLRELKGKSRIVRNTKTGPKTSTIKHHNHHVPGAGAPNPPKVGAAGAGGLPNSPPVGAGAGGEVPNPYPPVVGSSSSLWQEPQSRSVQSPLPVVAVIPFHDCPVSNPETSILQRTSGIVHTGAWQLYSER